MSGASIQSESISKDDGDSSQERAPDVVSPLPKVWIGFFLAALFLLYPFLSGFFPQVFRTRFGYPGGAALICLAALAYWLFCIYRFHLALEQTTQGHYPISPGNAAVFHLIPIFNFSWVFKWTSELSNYMNHKGRTQMASGWKMGLPLLLSFILLPSLDGLLPITCLFLTAMYVKRKLSIHLEVLERVMPHL